MQPEGLKAQVQEVWEPFVWFIKKVLRNHEMAMIIEPTK